ncbi:hypothetical protein SSE37_04740 [Sagittula stellata E-37]|uniref:Uncharacterized protein n=1 Tax=Sagittula stellata (strain ATCC 700073 / DSM 11524 / E-37) TaxID=388399 RepID=A3K1X8_SAGS3|nr:hypothetical protein SSE37_04740 [Sagittula stellata E-37]
MSPFMAEAQRGMTGTIAGSLIVAGGPEDA